MKILVTGGAGYVGSHVVNALKKTNHEIFVLDNLSKGHRCAVKDVPLFEVDLADKKALDEIFEECGIEAVMHFAANSLVGESMENPAKYYINNITYGLNLLEAMRAHNVRYLVFSSSAGVYGEPEHCPIPEEHPKNPTNTYGRTKLIFEQILADYDRAYGLKSIALRYFNAAGADPSGLIGEDHDPESHLIPRVLQNVLAGNEPMGIFGDDYNTPDGTCIRDYVHVNDLARAHLLALDVLFNGANSGAYNLGNGQGFSNKQIVEAASKVIGKEIPIVIKPRRAGDPAILVADSAKIKRELGWEPEYPELEGIIETAWKWHKNHPNGY